jgi:hypothetical protein
LEEQDVGTYAVAARVPDCALWNLLDCRDDDGVPLMTAVEWLRFIQSLGKLATHDVLKMTHLTIIHPVLHRVLHLIIQQSLYIKTKLLCHLIVTTLVVS